MTPIPPSRPTLARRARTSIAAVALAATALSGTAADAAAADATAADATGAPCRPWSERTVLSGEGALENLMPDGDGGMYLTDNSGGRLLRATPDGDVTTVASGLDGASGIAERDGSVYVSTGNNNAGNLFGLPLGTVVEVDPTSGDTSVWASGLVAPNGIAFLPDGSLVASRPIGVLGVWSGITRTKGGASGHDFWWVPTASSNGGGVDDTGTWYYVNNTLTSEVWRVRTSKPTQREKLATLPLLTGNDDLTLGPDGKVYVAGFVAGTVTEVDLATGRQCVVAEGLTSPSSVRFGDGTGFDEDKLYVTSFGGDGDLVELTRH